MSRSYHVTKKNFKACTKKDIDEQAKDSFSELHQWTEKLRVKREATENRKRKNPEK